MYQMTYKGKTTTFNNIEALSNELLWIWAEDLGLNYIFHSGGTVTFEERPWREEEPCKWCGLPVTEQTDPPADYCDHDGDL